MKKLAFLTLGLLAGCSGHRDAAYQAANQQCMDTKVRTGGSWVSLAECTNAVDEQYDTEPAGPLIRVTRLSLAYKVDHGEMSPEEARAELLRVASDARQEQQGTNAADAASAAANVGAMPRPAPQSQIARPTPGEETPVSPPSAPIEKPLPSPEHGIDHQNHQNRRRDRHQTAHRSRYRHQIAHQSRHHHQTADGTHHHGNQ